MLGLRLLHAVALLADFLAQLMDLGIESHALLVRLGELAGEHDSKFGAHLVAQPGIALGLAGLALERVHLPRDLFENVVHTIQISFGVFESRLGKTLLRLEFRNAGGLFDDGAAVRRSAAQNLTNASLLDERGRLGPKTGTHEEFLDIAQTAEFPIQQILAIAAAK